ncbi:GPI mannosyltransferase 4-like [Mercenaria mercenaria]|uniref:GPI mannosyltransferase 4-like n=1 Tax=Mercenaria mercenaria TaxID=6596 RepID=UPI00234EE26B|nr:GPI mannosyltransferase 4-like [Mercenaria mercenaria]
MSSVWTILLLLRLCWSVLPQSGYIHPDEFFQAVEVVAGDALNISVIRTWEFTSTYPLRNVVLPQIIFQPVFHLLKYADDILRFHMTGYHLVASYRLLMTLLSLWIDYCVYKICKVIGVQGHTANILLASSYVTLTFQTHTFSNSFETLLFITLVLLILMCIKKDEVSKRKRVANRFCSEVDTLRDFFSDLSRPLEDREDSEVDEEDLDSSFNDLHKNAFNLRKRNQEIDREIKQPKRGKQDEKAKVRYHFGRDSENSKTQTQKRQQQRYKNESIEQNSLYMYIAVMAVTVTFGVFNRPTFVIFAAIPFLWWSDKHPSGEKYVFKRAAVFIIIGVILSFIFVTLDTVYFSGMEISSLLTLNGWRKVPENYVITPLNFILYNIMATNLATHGYHPFYVHLLVNMPLLFGPMFIYLTRHVIKEFLILLNVLRKDNEGFQENKSTAELTIPVEVKLRNDFKGMLWLFIFFPAIVLSCFPHQEARFLIPLLPLVVISVVIFSKKLGKIFWAIFIIFNVLFSVVFGVLHQGGVIPSLMRLQQLTETEFKKNENISISLIFSNTYMPPKHVLLTQNSNLELKDLKGSNFQTVFAEIEKHKKLNSFTSSDKSINGKKIFIVLPGTLVTEFKARCDELISIKSETRFFPHLSFEDPPITGLIDSFKTFVDMMSLYLIEIE